MSDRSPLRIEKLRIDRAPGFPDGLKLLGPDEGFHERINLIYGPNASGKSSSARILQELVWQDPPPGIRAYASAWSDNERWDIHIENGSAWVQKNGSPDSLKGMPGREARGRYMLALHELIMGKEDDLAERIAREAIGGYDLEGAATTLAYSYSKRSKQIREYQEFEEKKKAYKEKLTEQETLLQAQEELQRLKEEEAEAEKGIRLKTLIEKALQLSRAEEELEEARRELANYPKVLENAKGHELEELRRTNERIDALSKELQDAEKVRKEQEGILENNPLPSEGIPRRTLDELEARIEKLKQQEKRIEELRERIAGQEEAEKEALQAIAPGTQAGEWEGLDLPTVNELDRSLQNAHRIRSEKEVLEKRIQKVRERPEKEEEKKIEADPESLKQGIELLREWLKKRGEPGIEIKWGIVLAGLGILNGVLSYALDLPGLIIGSILLILTGGFLTWKGRRAGDEKRTEAAFSKTGSPLPEHWDEESVEQRLEELEQARQEVLHRVEKEREEEKELQFLQERLEELGPEEERIREEAATLKERLGSYPELPENKLEAHAGLYWFLNHARQWQSAHIERKKAEKEQEEAKKDHSELLRSSNELFEKYRAEAAEDAENAQAKLQELKREEEDRKTAQDELKRREEEIEKGEREQKKLLEERKALYARFELDDGEFRKFEALFEKLEGYRNARERVRDAEKNAKQIQRELEELPHYEEERTRIEGMSSSELAAERDRLEDSPKKRDEVRDRISRISNDIERTKKGNQLEKTLKELDEANDHLEESFRENLSSITGKLIVDRLEDEFKDKVQHPVLEKASERLTRITKGRYRLELDRAGKDAFRAYDEFRGMGQGLEELSSGTRIQLLLSVRLAFLESQEPYLQLPLLADELLANSDEVRARAIIESLLSLADEGRQIFYFTAQADELAKWRSVLGELKGEEEHLKTIQLQGEGTKEELSPLDPELQEIRFFEDVPAPNGTSYQEYGERLGVPPFDLLTDRVESLHLWYLLEDPQKLHQLLSLRIGYWGPLRSFVEEAPSSELLGQEEFERIKKRCEFLERFQQLYRKGRPRPMDPEVLGELIQEVKGLGQSSYQDLRGLLEKKGGDPVEFLKGLENGELKGFGEQKIEGIREFLLDKGLLPREEPLEQASILARMNAFLNEKGLEQEDAERFLRRIIPGKKG